MPLIISKYSWHALLPTQSTPLMTSRVVTLDNANLVQQQRQLLYTGSKV